MSMVEKKEKAGQLIRSLMQNPRKILIVILFGNTLVNICFFSLSTAISFTLEKHYGKSSFILGGFFSVACVILFGEVIPKAIAVKKTLFLSRYVCFPIAFLVKILTPFIKILETITRSISSLFHADKKDRYMTPEELKEILSLSVKKGWILSREQEMLLDLMDISNIKVKELMIPRVDMIKASISSSEKHIRELFRQKKVRKIVIYGAHEDDVFGILYAKDFFLNPSQDIKSHIKKIPFVFETINVEKLLKFLCQQNSNAAFVVDEYGGIEGLITIEELIEELVGEMENEYEVSIPMIQKDEKKENCYYLSGSLSIKEWKESFRVDELEYSGDTIAGFVIFLLQRFPKKGDIVKYQNLVMEILEVQKYKILRLSLKIYPTEGEVKS